MTDQQWQDECNANWETAATELEADGWQKVGFHITDDGEPVFTRFHKDDKKVALRRMLGSSNWYTVEQ